MELLPTELREKIPRIGTEPEVPVDDMLVYTKFFDPTSNWRWYVLQYDGEDTFLGFVLTTHHALAGRFTLSELSSLRYRHHRLGELGVERDTYFEPVTVRVLRETEPVIADAFKGTGLNLLELDQG